MAGERAQQIGEIPTSYQQGLQASALRGELHRLQQEYIEWKSQQDERLQQAEMELAQYKVDLERELALASAAMATQLADAQIAVEVYAQAVARAITATENPYTYTGGVAAGGQPQAPTMQSSTLTLPV